MKRPKRVLFDVLLGATVVFFGLLRLVSEDGGRRWFGLLMVLLGAFWIAGQLAMARSAREAAERRAEGPPGEHAVVLVSAGRKPIQVIKALREALGLDLAAAKALTDTPGSTAVAGVDEAFATAVAEQVRAAGAEAEVVTGNPGEVVTGDGLE